MSGNRGARFEYRPALDGLRAVAVMAVFVYHLGYRWLPGGFLGVDIFFVLSGYLITSLLLVERDATGRIALGAFWLRRARRLLPALFLLLGVLSVSVMWVSAAAELPLRRADLLWTLFYGANWHFIASSQDYFAQFSSASPVRHTWSLAIEEQFYVVWPLVVVAVTMPARRARRARRAVAVVAALGVVASAVAAARLFTPADPSRAYYGTDARAFQPLAGALLAAVSAGDAPRWFRRAAPWIGAAAAAALLVAFCMLDARNPAYYDGLSLALTVSAAMLIWALDAAPSGAVARALSWRPVRWVGIVSYGVYLWHWPIVLMVTKAPAALLRLPGSTGLNLMRIVATFAIATASFYLVERPIRRGRVPGIGRSSVRLGVATVCAAALIVALTMWGTVPPVGIDGGPDIAECPSAASSPCVRYDAGRDAPVIATVGDSIARSLDQAFLAIAQEHHWTYVMDAVGGCRLSHWKTVHDGQPTSADEECYANTPGRLDRLLAEWNPRLIVAADIFEIVDAVGPGGQVVRAGTPAHFAMAESGLADAATHLTSGGARLVFMELLPVLSMSCGAPATRTLPSCRRLAADDPRQTPYNAIFRDVAARVPGVSTMSLADIVCPNGICTWEESGRVLRYDGTHFSHAAARWLAPAVLRRLSDLHVLPEDRPRAR